MGRPSPPGGFVARVRDERFAVVRLVGEADDGHRIDVASDLRGHDVVDLPGGGWAAYERGRLVELGVPAGYRVEMR
jgi:hypothetical protein